MAIIAYRLFTDCCVHRYDALARHSVRRQIPSHSSARAPLIRSLSRPHVSWRSPGDVVGPNATDRYGTRLPSGRVVWLPVWRAWRRRLSSRRAAALYGRGLVLRPVIIPVRLSPFYESTDSGLYTARMLVVVRTVPRHCCRAKTTINRVNRLERKKKQTRHGQVGQTEVHEKGKVQGEAESGAQDAAAQGTECNRHEL